MSDRTAYRLTKSDETTVSAAIRTTVDGWRATGWNGRGKVEALGSLVRVAAHSIGCGLADLRDSEVAWITERAKEAIS